MSAESLLTLASLAFAIYAFLPREQRLDWQLRMDRVAWAVAITSAGPLLYIKYYPVLDAIGWAIPLGPWRWGFDEERASLLIALASVGFLARYTRRASLSPSKFPTLQKLVDRLVQEEKFADLRFLLEQHIDSLMGLYAPTHPTSQQNRIWLIEQSTPDQRDAAFNTVNQVLYSDAFVRHLAKAQPDLALRVLKYEFAGQFEFVDIFIRALLDDRSSLLYRELRENQNLSGGGRYDIPTSNRLLHFFLSDVRVAARLNAYSPAAEYALNELALLGDKSEESFYNQPIRVYDTYGVWNDRWKCPIFAVLRFFDIMIMETIHQGVPDSMALDVVQNLVRGLVNNVRPKTADDDTDEPVETPNLVLIRECVSCLVRWASAVRDASTKPSDLDAQVDGPRWHGSHPSADASLILGGCIRTILECDALALDFKYRVLAIPLRALRPVPRAPLPVFAQRIGISIARGGDSPIDDPSYRNRLLQSLGGLVRHQLDQLCALPELGPIIASVETRLDRVKLW